MKNLFSVIVIIFLFLIPSFAGEDYFSLISEGEKEYNGGNYRIAGELYEEAFKIGPETSNINYYYFAASAWALAGEKVYAFKYLNGLLDKGWMDPEEIKEMECFEDLHNDERWQEILLKIQQIEEGYDKELKEKLENIYEEDQKYRGIISDNKYDPASSEMENLMGKMKECDEKNLSEIIRVIDEYGWPGKSIAGVKGSRAVFLVIQHSNLETQEKYFPYC